MNTCGRFEEAKQHKSPGDRATLVAPAVPRPRTARGRIRNGDASLRVTLRRTPSGGWVVDTPGLGDAAGESFRFDGRVWAFRCVEIPPSDGAASEPLSLRDLHLSFAVSTDEDDVALRLQSGTRTYDLGVRNHHYLLLTLARQRLADAALGLAGPGLGWLDPADYQHDPMLAASRLNLYVCRIRKQFASFGIVDAAQIIERRPRGPLRLGTARFSVEPL